MGVNSGVVDGERIWSNVDKFQEHAGIISDGLKKVRDDLVKTKETVDKNEIKIAIDFKKKDLEKYNKTMAEIKAATKKKKDDPGSIRNFTNTSKYYQNLNNAQATLITSWNKLGEVQQENNYSMEQMLDSTNKSSTEVLRYANAFEALGGDLGKVSPQLKEFVDRMREIDSLKPESGYSYTVKNFKNTFKYLNQMREEGAADFPQFELPEVEMPKINTIEWANAAQSARETAEATEEAAKASGEAAGAADDAAKKAEESAKKTEESEERKADAAEKSAERQKKAYKTVEELRKELDSKQREKKQINNDYDISGAQLDQELSALERYKKGLEEIKEARDRALKDAQQYHDMSVDKYNEGDDEGYRRYQEQMEQNIEYYHQYSDELEYVQQKLAESAKDFKPGDAWGADEIQALITLIQNLLTATENISKAFGQIDDDSGIPTLLQQMNELATEISAVVLQMRELQTTTTTTIKGINPNMSLNIGGGGSGGNNLIQKTMNQAKYSTEALSKFKAAYESLFDMITKESNQMDVFRGRNDLFQQFLSATELIEGKSKTAQLTGYRQIIDVLKEVASVKGIDLSQWSEQFEKVAVDAGKAFDKVISGEQNVENATQQLSGVFAGMAQLGNAAGSFEALEKKFQDLVDIITRLQEVLSKGLGVKNDTTHLDKLNQSMAQLITTTNTISETFRRMQEASIVSADTSRESAEGMREVGETTSNSLEGIKEDAQEAKEAVLDLNNVLASMGEIYKQQGREGLVKALDTKSVTKQNMIDIATEQGYVNEKGNVPKSLLKTPLAEFIADSYIASIGATTEAIKKQDAATKQAAESQKELNQEIANEPAQVIQASFSEEQVKQLLGDLRNLLEEIQKVSDAFNKVDDKSGLPPLYDQIQKITTAITDLQNNLPKIDLSSLLTGGGKTFAEGIESVVTTIGSISKTIAGLSEIVQNGFGLKDIQADATSVPEGAVKEEVTTLADLKKELTEKVPEAIAVKNKAFDEEAKHLQEVIDTEKGIIGQLETELSNKVPQALATRNQKFAEETQNLKKFVEEERRILSSLNGETNVKESINQENTFIGALTKELENVPFAIQKKNEAFDGEVSVVQAAMAQEKEYVQDLTAELEILSYTLENLKKSFGDLGESNTFDGMIKSINESKDALKDFATILGKTKAEREEAVEQAKAENAKNAAKEIKAIWGGEPKDQVFTPGTEQWKQLVELLKKAGFQMENIVSITRNARKEGSAFLESFRVKDINGIQRTLGISTDGGILNESRNIWDVSKINKDLEKLKTAKTQQEFDELAKSIKSSIDELKQFSGQSKETDKAIDQLSKALNSAKTAGRKSISAATVEKDSKAIQSQIDKLSTVKTQKEFDDLTGSIQRMLDKLKGLSHVSKDTKKAIQELSVSFTKAKLDSARNVEAEEASRKAAEEARMMQEENAKIYAEEQAAAEANRKAFEKMQSDEQKYLTKEFETDSKSRILEERKKKYDELAEAVKRYIELMKYGAQGKALEGDAAKIEEIEKKIYSLTDELANSHLFSKALEDAALRPLEKLQETLDLAAEKLERAKAGKATGQTNAQADKEIQAEENRIKKQEELIQKRDELNKKNQQKAKDTTENKQIKDAKKAIDDYIASVEKLDELSERQSKGENVSRSLGTKFADVEKKSKAATDAIKVLEDLVKSGSSNVNLESLVEQLNRFYEAEDKASHISLEGFDTLEKSYTNIIALADKYFAILAKKDTKGLTVSDQNWLNQYAKYFDMAMAKIKEYKGDLQDASQLSGIFGNMSEEMAAQLAEALSEAKQNAYRNTFDTKMNSIDVQLTQLEGVDEGAVPQAYLEQVTKIRENYNALQTTIDNIDWDGDAKEKIKEVQVGFANLKTQMEQLQNGGEYHFIDPTQRANMAKTMAEWMANNSKAKDAISQINPMYEKMASNVKMTDAEGQKLFQTFRKIAGGAAAAGKSGKSFAEKLKGSFGNLTRYLLSFASFYRVINIFRQGISVVSEMNTALTELRKVSDETVSTLERFQRLTFDYADSVGTTAKQLQESTADFLRLGWTYCPALFLQ